MKKISLKVNERLLIMRFLNDVYAKGGLDLRGLRLATKLIEKVEIPADEQKKLGFRFENEGKRVLWEDKKDKGMDIELSEDETKLLVETIQKKDKEKGLTMADLAIVSLNEKLEEKEEKK